MLILQDLSYTFPHKELLFEGLSLSVQRHDKIALVGPNGVGKSTLLRLIAGQLSPSQGQVIQEAQPCYIPQLFGQFNHLKVGQTLGVETKLRALQAIVEGRATEADYTTLNDDWTLESRCEEALRYWKVEHFEMDQTLATLSGGQKTRLLLAGMMIRQPELILLDEPSNHLDREGRELLYDFIQSTRSTLLIVSHDRKLLHLLDPICEMKGDGIARYGGNYAFYVEQKELERQALTQSIAHQEKMLRKARSKQRESMQRQQKQHARGKKKHLKAGTPKVVINQLKNDAENSSAKLKEIHSRKIEGVSTKVQDLREARAAIDKMKFGFEDSALHSGKMLVEAEDIQFSFGETPLWPEPLRFRINSGARIALQGANGSGKTSLIRMILGELEPKQGRLRRAIQQAVYIDQDYSLIDPTRTIQDQAQNFNTAHLPPHEVNIRLNRFLFPQDVWDKSCGALSGGERMRLMLCCLTLSQQAPDLIILDEPTNNLDIQNIEILTRAIQAYRGTLIVVSHDAQFLEEVGVERSLEVSP